jgi:hypothetical protein
MHAATRYRPQADKIMRIYAQTAMIENGFVHLPETAPWLALYLYELSCFPYGRHDDQVPPDTLFWGRPRRCSTGSKRPGAKTASSPITACSQKSAAARNAAERPPTGGAATPWSDICPTAQVFSRSVRACFRSQQAIQRAPDEVWKVLGAGASVSVLISFEFLLRVQISRSTAAVMGRGLPFSALDSFGYPAAAATASGTRFGAGVSRTPTAETIAASAPKPASA